MLILVAVTISMAVNGGLFGYAGNAARETEIEKNKETRLANVPSNLTTEGLIDYYTKGEVELAKFTYMGEFGEETPEEFTFEIGMTWKDWIDSDYNPYKGQADKFTYGEGSSGHGVAYDGWLIDAYMDWIDRSNPGNSVSGYDYDEITPGCVVVLFD